MTDRHDASTLTRRQFLRTGGAGLAALTCAGSLTAADLAVSPAIRGLVMVPETLAWADWPSRAKRVGLNTLVLHHPESPKALLEFVQSKSGAEFREQCTTARIDLEFDFHAMRDLVPRDLFKENPSLFRMDKDGRRTPVLNFCVSSTEALRIAGENAVKYAKEFQPTTGCYYYWSDACAEWCRCEKCRELSDSDQLLLAENALVAAIRKSEPQAQVAHLACHASMPAPSQVKPAPGVFLQYAPVRRDYDVPYSRQTDKAKLDSLWFLEENLKVFPAKTAQIVEYWLDVTRFPPGSGPLPWNRERFLADLATYKSFGLRHIKSFANGLDADYVKRHGEPKFLREFAQGLEATFN
jgi:hypothetical protein